MISKEQAKRLLHALLTTEDPKKLTEILKGFKDSDWLPIGGRPDNHAVISAAGVAKEAGIIELLTNAFDACIFKDLELRGIIPTSSEAPSSARAASEMLYGFPGGIASHELATPELKDKITLMATGHNPKDLPNITVIDKGVGVHPQDIPNTILSIMGGNKANISCSAGQFGFGGNAKFSFCKHALIITRHFSESGKWGVTITRERMPDANKREKNSVYEYLAPEGKILEIEADSVEALPKLKQQAQPYVRPLSSGTIIKMFNYELGRISGSLVHDFTSQVLHSSLVWTLLPISVIEARPWIKTNKMDQERICSTGLFGRLDKIDGKYIEGGRLENCLINSSEFGPLNVKIAVFKAGNSNGNNRYYGNNSRHSVNIYIDCQKRMTLGFSALRDVGLECIAKSTMVFVDASRMDRHQQLKIFNPSRTGVKDREITDRFIKTVEEFLKNNETLKKYESKRAAEIRRHASKDIMNQIEKIKAQLLQNSFGSLGSGNGPKIDYAPIETSAIEAIVETTEIKGADYPSFIKLFVEGKEITDTNPTIAMPKGKRTHITLETDVSDRFFREDKGTIECIMNPADSVQVSELNIKGCVIQMSVEHGCGSVDSLYPFTVCITPTNPSHKAVETAMTMHFLPRQIIPGQKAPRPNIPGITRKYQKKWNANFPEILPVDSNNGPIPDAEITSEQDFCTIIGNTIYINMGYRPFMNACRKAKRSGAEHIHIDYLRQTSLIAINVKNAINKGLIAPEQSKSVISLMAGAVISELQIKYL